MKDKILTIEKAEVLSILMEREQPIKTTCISAITGYPDRLVRKVIRALIIEDGVNIGSSPRESCGGFYIIRTPEEFQAVYNSLVSRGLKILQRASRIKKTSIQEVFNQGILAMQKRGEQC